jgi:hypothetical protein
MLLQLSLRQPTVKIASYAEDVIPNMTDDQFQKNFRSL